MTDTATSTDQLLTLGAAAAKLGVTYRSVRRYVARGQLAAVNISDTKRGPTWRVNETELERFKAEKCKP